MTDVCNKSVVKHKEFSLLVTVNDDNKIYSDIRFCALVGQKNREQNVDSFSTTRFHLHPSVHVERDLDPSQVHVTTTRVYKYCCFEIQGFDDWNLGL